MLHPTDEAALARERLEKFQRERAEERVVRATRHPRYARSGAGYRFIPAGAALFEACGEQTKAA